MLDDLSRYDQAVRARRRGIAATYSRYAHQREAYAEAMQAWREQVAACHAGDGRACRAPTPDPAAFYWRLDSGPHGASLPRSLDQTPEKRL